MTHCKYKMNFRYGETGSNTQKSTPEKAPSYQIQKLQACTRISGIVVSMSLEAFG
jgi:hypothetical protein